MTIFFRTLGDIEVDEVDLTVDDTTLIEPLIGSYYAPAELTGELLERTATWFRSYIELSRTTHQTADARRSRMHAVNPKYVLRNYLAQLAIDKAEAGGYDMIPELLDLLRHPYDEQPGREEYATLRPDWARTRVGCSMLSCSS